MTRNSRMPDSPRRRPRRRVLRLPDGRAPAGELFERYGRDTIEAAFDAILDKTTETYRREILSKIPDGDVRLGGLRRARRRRRAAAAHPADHPDQELDRRPGPGDGGPKLIIDFTGTAPQAKGPINHCGDYVGGNFLKKWLAPILRNLADTPERMAELDVNEGIVPLIEMRFPEKGTLLTPIFPAPTNARTFVILRLLGVLAGVVAKAVDGKMPADQETIRYTGVYGKDRDGNDYLMREVLGGGSGGRYYADGEDTIHVVPDSRNLPDRVHREPVPVHRRAARPRRRLRRRRALPRRPAATRSTSGCSRTPTSCPSPTARSSPAGASRAARPAPFEVTVDLGGPDERVVDALADAEPVKAGQVIRIRTTGGGGWGDPLERPYDEVERDLRWGKVSFEGARRDYGVVASGDQGRARHRRRRPRTRCARELRGGPRGRAAVLRPRPRLRDARRGTDCGRRRLGLTVDRPVLVIGAAGKTGRAVTRALAARGVTGARCGASPGRASSVCRWGPVDLGAVDLDDRAGSGRRPRRASTAVYHLAPNVHPDEVGMAEPGRRRGRAGRRGPLGVPLRAAPGRRLDAAPPAQGPRPRRSLRHPPAAGHGAAPRGLPPEPARRGALRAASRCRTTLDAPVHQRRPRRRRRGRGPGADRARPRRRHPRARRARDAQRARPGRGCHRRARPPGPRRAGPARGLGHRAREPRSRTRRGHDLTAMFRAYDAAGSRSAGPMS